MPIFGKIITGLIGYFSNTGSGHKIGATVINTTSLLALAPIAIWLIAHKDAEAVKFSFTYGQLAITGLFFFFIVKIAHYTRPGNRNNRNDFKE